MQIGSSPGPPALVQARGRLGSHTPAWPEGLIELAIIPAASSSSAAAISRPWPPLFGRKRLPKVPKQNDYPVLYWPIIPPVYVSSSSPPAHPFGAHLVCGTTSDPTIAASRQKQLPTRQRCFLLCLPRIPACRAASRLSVDGPSYPSSMRPEHRLAHPASTPSRVPSSPSRVPSSPLPCD